MAADSPARFPASMATANMVITLYTHAGIHVAATAVISDSPTQLAFEGTASSSYAA